MDFEFATRVPTGVHLEIFNKGVARFTMVRRVDEKLGRNIAEFFACSAVFGVIESRRFVVVIESR